MPTLDGLIPGGGANPPSATPDPNSAPAAPADAAAPNIPPRPMMVMRAIANGQLPGAFIPKDAPKDPSGGIPIPDMNKMGLGIYKPTQTKSIVGVIFSPKTLPLKAMEHLDKAGKLESTFPSVVDLINGPGGASSGPSDDATGAGAPTDADGNAASPTPGSVPILPRPTFGATAQSDVANSRLTALDGGKSPSQRLVPGGGKVLNGLMARAS